MISWSYDSGLCAFRFFFFFLSGRNVILRGIKSLLRAKLGRLWEQVEMKGGAHSDRDASKVQLRNMRPAA